jgi:putative protease
MNYPLELLAPARDLTTGKAAIDYGADAVYIGAPTYGARASAGNSVADIEKLVNYAHIFKARVYVALNTLLRDEEIDDAIKLAYDLWNAGADALIIQDYGLTEAGLPPIALHASTQMHNSSAAKVLFLEKCGFRQVVLARETSLETIREIRAATTVPLEFFVHGALCVCYSGHCHLSKHLTGRSANRGECAQPCRAYYDVISATGKSIARQAYALSPKDLNLSNHLEELIEAGVSSFKIEGRLKGIDYVKNITAWYRQRLDQYLNLHPERSRASSGSSAPDFVPNPQKSFNRDFTTYFLHNRPADLLSPIPRSIGEPLGTVTQVKGKWLMLSNQLEIKAGDGLVFLNPDASWGGARVNKVDNNRLELFNELKIKPGARAFRNEDPTFTRLLEKSDTRRKILLHTQWQETSEGFALHLTDEDNITSNTSFTALKIPAQNPDNARRTIIQSLMKDKDSPFKFIIDVDENLAGKWHLTASQVNNLRRDALDKHIILRQKHFSPKPVPWNLSSHPYPVDDFLPFLEITNHLQEKFFERHGVNPSILRQLPPPPLMVTKHCLRYTYGVCPRHQVYDPDRDPALLLNNRNKLYLSYDCNHCVMMIRKEKKP